MKQIFSILAAASILLFQTCSAEDSPTVSLSVKPEIFTVGTQFEATCTLGGFKTDGYFRFVVGYYFVPETSKNGSPKITFQVANFTVFQDSSKYIE